MFPDDYDLIAVGTINPAYVAGSANHANFPTLLATFTETMFGVIDDGGGGLAFSTDALGDTQIPCEVVSCDTGGGTNQVYARLEADYNDDTLIYAWHKSGGSQPAVDAVYGRNAVWSSFKCCFHCEADGTDSAGYVDMTDMNIPTYAAGKLGNGVTFAQASSQYWNNTVSGIMQLGIGEAIYAECWLNPTSNESTDNVFASGYNGGGNTYYAFGLRSLKWSQNIKNDAWYSADTAIPTGAWSHVASSFGGSAGTTIKMVRNGVADGTPTEAAVLSATTATNGFEIASNGVPGGYYNGGIDELRIAFSDLGADWATTSYNNQNAPNTFMSWEDVEAGSGTNSRRTLIGMGI